mgnify:CR=1 FL=1
MNNTEYGFELNEIEIAQSEYQKSNQKVNNMISDYTNKSGELVKDLQAFYYKHQNVLRKNV